MPIVKFFKENSRIITSLISFQLGIDVFSAIVSLSTYNISEKVFLYSGIFCIVFYLFLILTATNDEGAKDSVRIASGRVAPMPLKGLFISLYANSVNLLFAVIIIIAHFAGAIQVRDAFKIIAYFLQGMYGPFLTLFAGMNPFFYLLIPIPAIIVSTLFYYIGMRGVLLIPEKKRKN